MAEATYPKLDYDGKEFYKIGCRECAKGGPWEIFTDGHRYVARCRCGHICEIKPKTLRREPDA